MCTGKNLRNFKSMVRIGGQESRILEEIINMSERYVAKLIPKVRRNYLPDVRMLNNVKISYRDINKEEKQHIDLGESSVSDIILYMIYQKTGMKFLREKSGKNYFLPDNLRNTINLIVLLAEMEEPEGENINDVYYYNIEKFSDYYERQWLPGNFTLKESKEIRKIFHVHSQLHQWVMFRLSECYSATKMKGEVPLTQPYAIAESSDSFCLVLNWMELYRINVFGEEEKNMHMYFMSCIQSV